MKKYFLLLTANLFFAVSLFSQITFQKTYGSVYGNQANAIISTNAGGYAVAGWYDVEGSFTAEFYLVLIDAQGDTLLTKTYGSKVDTTANLTVNGSGNEGYNLIQTDDDGFFFIGERHEFPGGPSEVFAVKINATGEMEWSKTYGGFDNEYGLSVHQTDDGGYAIGGFTESFGTGTRNFYLLRTNSFGDILWTKTYGGTSIEAANQIQPTSDGGYIMVGYSFSFGAGNSDIFVIKTDEDGEIIWEKTYGGDLNDLGLSITLTEEGGYIICGGTESFGAGNSDVLIVKINADGEVQWSKTYGGSGYELGASITKTANNDFIIAGYTRSFGAGGEDFYVLKIDTQGDTIWTKTFGGESDDSAKSVISTSDNGCIIAGYTRTFGAGGLEMYVVKTDEGGFSECGQNAAGTIISEITITVTSTNADIDEGGTTKVPTTLVGNTNTETSNPCDIINGVKNDLKKLNFEIFPNPANDFLIIKNFEDGYFFPKRILIYDVLGKQIQSFSLNKTEEKIDISMIPSGVFFLNLIINEQHFTYNFVKQ